MTIMYDHPQTVKTGVLTVAQPVVDAKGNVSANTYSVSFDFRGSLAELYDALASLPQVEKVWIPMWREWTSQDGTNVTGSEAEEGV